MARAAVPPVESHRFYLSRLAHLFVSGEPALFSPQRIALEPVVNVEAFTGQLISYLCELDSIDQDGPPSLLLHIEEHRADYNPGRLQAPNKLPGGVLFNHHRHVRSQIRHQNRMRARFVTGSALNNIPGRPPTRPTDHDPYPPGWGDLVIEQELDHIEVCRQYARKVATFWSPERTADVRMSVLASEQVMGLIGFFQVVANHLPDPRLRAAAVQYLDARRGDTVFPFILLGMLTEERTDAPVRECLAALADVSCGTFVKRLSTHRRCLAAYFGM